MSVAARGMPLAAPRICIHDHVPGLGQNVHFMIKRATILTAGPTMNIHYEWVFLFRIEFRWPYQPAHQFLSVILKFDLFSNIVFLAIYI